MPRTPLSTYRIQFNANFRFVDAIAIVPYLDAMGITDLYSSPILKARPGSTHGYDLVDPTALNPELGTDEEFTELTQALTTRGMGLLLDIVPNHMAASSENAWWMSLLENGPHSRYIEYFDIEWQVLSRAEGERKVLLPVLGRPYGEVLESGELRLDFDEKGFFLRYFDRRFPLAPHTYHYILETCLELSVSGRGMADSTERELRELLGGSDSRGSAPARDRPINSKFIKETLWRLHLSDGALQSCMDSALKTINGMAGQESSFEILDRVLEQQWYRLAHWRLASEGINYRRFFDVTDLVGVRIEEPEVFEARHARLFELIEEGKVTGLRIDHIDGLYDPVGHLRKLQSRIGPKQGRSFHVVLEKILGKGESLTEEFAAAGTTGYDYLNFLSGVFIEPRGLKRLGEIYRKQTGRIESYSDTCYRRKRQVIRELFAGEIRRLSARLEALAAQDRIARDFAPTDLFDALVAVTASLPIYRTYTRDFHVAPRDQRYIEEALAETRRQEGSAIDERVLHFLERALLLKTPHYIEPTRSQWLDFVMRWQQFTGRVMAKGVEDTAFYLYHRLLSLNEVGGEPDNISQDTLADFHHENAARAHLWPMTLNATSTHDTKRSEDLRARLDVLTDLPDQWGSHFKRWARVNTPLRSIIDAQTVPDLNEEYMIYQTLLGVWPLYQSEEASLPDRLDRYLEKALREARQHSSWTESNERYEMAVKEFVRRVIDPSNKKFFLSFRPFQKSLAFHGMLNSLAQLLLKITSPGIPDFYQGTELWDLSLVDPDNRRPVDFRHREKTLRSLAEETVMDRDRLTTLLGTWRDGRIKLYLTSRALGWRRKQPALFSGGDYIPLTAAGKHATKVCAFGRRISPSVGSAETWGITIVPRLLATVIKRGTLPVGQAVWGDTVVRLPSGAPTQWRNVLTGEAFESNGGVISLAGLFATLPFALLESIPLQL